MNRHCGECAYFGEPIKLERTDEEYHVCHNFRSIYKFCTATATGCFMFERGFDKEEENDNSRHV